ncbi:MAG: FecR domain-containing protein [Alphaproteobacteria bacterium]|nr:FecR domain-containing protein [Alphaproteobacteria bacterium]
MSEKTAHQIDTEAADWAARFDSGPLTAALEQEFRGWLDGDVRALGAYARIRAVALATERARALGPDFDPAAFEAAPPSVLPRRRVLQLGGAIAAAALVALGTSWQILRNRGRFSTAKGETKVVALKDGSVVTLNTASEIRVEYSDTLRSVELVRGEALFDVAKNKARPFVVAAGDTSVRVVGTSFSVSRFDTAPIRVLVREGIVEVFKPDAANIQPVRITANTMAMAPADQADIVAQLVPSAQVRRAMAWREGQIAFEGQTLAQAAAEFSRYSDTKIVVEDPALAREEIAGLFKATDPVGFANTIAISLNAHVHVGEGEVRLTR